MDSEVYPISKDTMEGTGEELFDHIAQCLAVFIKDRNIESECLPLGFTFSFPCRQKGLAVGELISWTKVRFIMSDNVYLSPSSFALLSGNVAWRHFT